MQLKQRIKRIENTFINDVGVCAETCRQHPEIITNHESNGADIPTPEWWTKQGIQPILEVCDRCRKPTRRETIVLNWIAGGSN